MNRKGGLLVLMTLIMGTVLAPINLGFAQQDERITTDRLLSIVDGAKTNLENAFDRFEAQSLPIPDVARDRYLTGLSIADEATQLREAGNLDGAREKALEAMRNFREAFLEISVDIEKSRTEDELEALRAQGLEATATRLEEALKRIDEAAQMAEDRGLDASNLNDKVSEAKSHIESVRSLIQAGELEEGADRLEAAENVFGQAIAEMRPVVDWNKANQVNNFLIHSEDRLERVSSLAVIMLETIAEMLPPAAQQGIEMARQVVNQATERAQERLAEVRELLLQGRVEDAIPKLDELRGEVTQILDAVKQRRPEVGSAMEEIDRLGLAIEVLEMRAVSLEGRQVDVSVLVGRIDEARTLMLDTIEFLKQQDLSSVDETLNNVEAIVEAAKSLADQLEG